MTRGLSRYTSRYLLLSAAISYYLSAEEAGSPRSPVGHKAVDDTARDCEAWSRVESTPPPPPLPLWLAYGATAVGAVGPPLGCLALSLAPERGAW